jgi:hypothetical protein
MHESSLEKRGENVPCNFLLNTIIYIFGDESKQLGNIEEKP